MPAAATPYPIEAEIPDTDLVKRAQAGNARAFNQLVTRYRGKVYGMCYQLVQNDQDAWDLAQDTFIRAWKSLLKFKGDSAFYTWLYRIAHNVSYDWMRRKRHDSDGEFNDETGRATAVGAATVPPASLPPDDALNHRELGAKILSAISQLGPDHRMVVMLREVEGLSYDEIASTMGSSVGTVMSRLYYARKKLQELLKDTYENHG